MESSKWVLLGLAVIVLYLYCRPLEGFQGTTPSRRFEDQLFPVLKTVERKDTSLGSEVNGVPLTIYHSWGTNEIPFYMKKNIEMILHKNPEFNYSFNDDIDCRSFIQKHFDKGVVEAFDCIKPGAYKSDLWRYCVLYINGGVYMDIKCYTNVKLINIIKETPLVFVKNDPVFPECIWNGFMISPPNNPIFKLCIDEVVRMVKERDKGANSLDLTGPCLLGRVVKLFLPRYPFMYEERQGTILDMAGKTILSPYVEYRNEQKRFQKTKHYTELWDKSDIYQC